MPFLLVCLLLPASVIQAQRAADPSMNYRVVENYYGPDIRFLDWRVTRGDLATDHEFRGTRNAWNPGGEGVNALFSAGGAMQIFSTGPATVTRSDYHFGGGGDVEIRLAGNIERMGADGMFRIRFHDARTGSGETGVAISLAPGEVVATLRGEPLGRRTASISPGQTFEATLAILANRFEVQWNGETIASGVMVYEAQDNEGWTHLDVRDAGVRIVAFEENFIAHPETPPPWAREELLYEEAFGAESWRDNWVLNGVDPEIGPASFKFRPMSNVILNRRFNGPIAVDVEATPVHNEDFSAGLTDAIFMWMMDHPDGDLPAYMKSLPDAGRQHYLEIPFYWMDFGGTNNVTTRLRRSPGLRMIRQFDDRPRLLERDRTYQITLVQYGEWLEFWVDGERWIQAWDPEPLTSGYIGHRAFNSELRISGIKVWRIQ